mgnify:FL=1
MTTYTLPKFPSHSSCKLCDLHQEAKNPGVPTRFHELSAPITSSPLIVIGQNPGSAEDNANECFSGPSGKLLTSVYLNHDEIMGHPIYLTNAARCPTLGENEKPKRKHYRACSGYLNDDIETILTAHSPHKSFVLCLGAYAYSAVSRMYLDKERTLRHGFNNQGQPNTSGPEGMLYIYTTFHPAAILRNKKYLYPVADHIELLCNAINGRIPSPSLPKIEEPRWPD